MFQSAIPLRLNQAIGSDLQSLKLAACRSQFICILRAVSADCAGEEKAIWSGAARSGPCEWILSTAKSPNRPRARRSSRR
ncbi:hypothetical protein QQF64_030296 [Cirrhinus molitorella]|uniref:Uncharacterized protein n=1 Tax=Cirrhinus molitorella TaxID=172907 RepID=A0ABR3N2X9_9TELE